MKSDYIPKKIRDVAIGDHVMLAETPPFIVEADPKWVSDKPGSKTGHVHVQGRTARGHKASGKVYDWDHTVLCIPGGATRRAIRNQAKDARVIARAEREKSAAQR
jgi:hypothetical protein